MLSLRSITTNAAFILALIFTFSVPWENAIPIPGIGTISRALGIPLLAIWLVKILTTNSARSPAYFHIFAGLYVLWCASTIVWTVDPDISLKQIQTFTQLFILCYILWTELYTERRCMFLIQAYVLGAVVVILFIYVNYYNGNVTRWSRRATIAGIDENDIALVISTALPMAWMLATTASNYAGRLQPFLNVFNLLVLPAGLVAIIMTGSRGGFASTIPTYIYILVNVNRFSIRNRLLFLPALGAAVVAIIYFAPTKPLERIITTFEELDSRNISGRGDIWNAGLNTWFSTDFSALFGIGIGGYFSDIGRAAHSTPISVLVETGVLGLLLFAAVILSLLYASVRGIHKYRYTSFSIAVLSVWFIGVSALTWEYRKPTWIIWSIIICLAYSLPAKTDQKSVESDGAV